VAVQPLLSFIAIVLFLSLASIVARFVTGWRVFAVALLAAQPALVVAFALQGSIKELTALAVVLAAIALVVS